MTVAVLLRRRAGWCVRSCKKWQRCWPLQMQTLCSCRRLTVARCAQDSSTSTAHCCVLSMTVQLRVVHMAATARRGTGVCPGCPHRGTVTLAWSICTSRSSRASPSPQRAACACRCCRSRWHAASSTCADACCRWACSARTGRRLSSSIRTSPLFRGLTAPSPSKSTSCARSAPSSRARPVGGGYSLETSTRSPRESMPGRRSTRRRRRCTRRPRRPSRRCMPTGPRSSRLTNSPLAESARHHGTRTSRSTRAWLTAPSIMHLLARRFACSASKWCRCLAGHQITFLSSWRCRCRKLPE
mmetsp:Transcript_7473/g.19115  ORF Transcript_7473/g.19115 Transcript_7473/m.19115 type:complete len:299 (-) Transcript_7473:365-1261(-)